MTLARLLPAVAALTASAVPAVACPFCSTQGQTLSGEVNQADFIVVGTMTNAKRDPGDFTRGSTELVIETAVKPHPYLSGRTKLVIPRVIEAPPDQSKFLVFASLYPPAHQFPLSAAAGAAVLGDTQFFQLDAYRGEPVKGDSKLAEYLTGAAAVREKDAVSRLRFFFDYLDAADLVIGTDALMEFGNADYKDVRKLAPTLPAEKILGWIKDPNTPASRYGLYGLFLGHCGKPADARAVRELLDGQAKTYSSGLDGIIAGYVMLDPKAGWDYLKGILSDPKQEFPVRYAGLKVLRFFWEYRPDVIPHAQVLDGMAALVAQADMADLPIEDLRKWGRWDKAGLVLTYAGQESHNRIPIVRRAILRFALSAAAHDPAAAAYVARQRKDDPERVQFVEQMLKDEAPKPPATAGTTPPKPAGGS